MSAARPKTVFLGLDATDLHLAQAFAVDGSMPTLDHLLHSAAVVETVAPVGFFARRPAALPLLASGGGAWTNRPPQL